MFAIPLHRSPGEQSICSVAAVDGYRTTDSDELLWIHGGLLAFKPAFDTIGGEKGMSVVFTFNKKYKIALFLLTLVVVLFGIFGNNGVFSFYGLRKQDQRLISENEAIKYSNQSLRYQIHLLKEDRYYIEKIAREEMGLVKKDEVILRFER